MDKLGNNGRWTRFLCFVSFMADGAFLLMASRHIARSSIPWLILLCLALSVLSGAGFMAAGVKSLRLKILLRWLSAMPGVFVTGCFLPVEGFANMTCSMILSKVFWAMLFWIPFLASMRGMALRITTIAGLCLLAFIPCSGLFLLAYLKCA